MQHFEGQLDGRGRRFGIVASRFNSVVVEALLSGALDCLRRHGVDDEDIVVVRVPGAWEIPAALRALAQRGGLDGLVALGALIRGETSHFDVLSATASQGIAGIATEFGLAVGFGLLTCETSEQAAARAGGKLGNKGWEAASAALEMADLLGRLGPSGVEDRKPKG